LISILDYASANSPIPCLNIYTHPPFAHCRMRKIVRQLQRHFRCHSRRKDPFHFDADAREAALITDHPITRRTIVLIELEWRIRRMADGSCALCATEQALCIMRVRMGMSSPVSTPIPTRPELQLPVCCVLLGSVAVFCVLCFCLSGIETERPRPIWRPSDFRERMEDGDWKVRCAWA